MIRGMVSSKILWMTCILAIILLSNYQIANGAPAKKGAKPPAKAAAKAAKPAAKAQPKAAAKAVAKVAVKPKPVAVAKAVLKATTKAADDKKTYQEQSKTLGCQFLHGDYLLIRRIVQLGDVYGEGRVKDNVFRDVFERKTDYFTLLSKDSDSLFCHLDRNGDGTISQADVVHSRHCHGATWPFFQFELFDNNINDEKLGSSFIQTGILYTNVLKKHFISKKPCTKGKPNELTFDEVYAEVSKYCTNNATPGCAPIEKPYPTSHAQHAKQWRALFETERITTEAME
jgi:hypothetical protein